MSERLRPRETLSWLPCRLLTAQRAGRVGAAVAIAMVLANVASSPASAAAASGSLLEIATVPAIPGVTFLFDGKAHTSDQHGMVKIQLKPRSEPHTLSIRDRKTTHGAAEFRFRRWWYQGHHGQDFRKELKGIRVERHLRITAAFRGSYGVNYTFVDQAKVRVPRQRVTRVEFHGDHGQTVTGNGSGRIRMVGVRPIISGGTLVAKEVRYGVQRVDVDGSNVVQINKQVFIPSQKSSVVVPLLLRTAHFATRDFLFGHPVGTSLRLTYPDGRVSTVPLDTNGKATIESLARGRYSVAVTAPGYAFDRPLVLSRNQYVDLPVLTFLDLAVIGCAVVIVIVGLYVLRVRTGRRRGRPA